MIKILYISSLCSEKLLQHIYDTAIQKPEQAAQKFHRLLGEGFGFLQEECYFQTLSSLPITPTNHTQKFWKKANEKIKGINYNYIPFINFPVIKNVGIFIYTFFKVLLWSILKKRKNKVVICDILNITASYASLIACKLTNTKCIAIVTDLPGMMITNSSDKQLNILKSGFKKVSVSVLKNYSGYLLLTEQMNDVVNPKSKPHIIMEGLVDLNMKSSVNKLEKKSEDKILIYAGGLYEKYGIKMLIEAFTGVKDQFAKLHLYGRGNFVNEIHEYSKHDCRIVYKGMVPNKTVVEDQLAATLLINHRPTSEEFTKYSFPSKNMEYMVSGTPMITTKLPGMPKEYQKFVFLFQEETVVGMTKVLENALNMSKEELHEFGKEAKQFVIQNKNNKVQAQRIFRFINSV